MLLMIAHNPHSDHPEELQQQLQIEAGQSYIDNTNLDKEGLQDLKQLLSS